MTEKYEYCSTVPRNFVQDFFTEMNWNWFPYKNLQEKDSSCNFSLDWKLFQVWQAAKLSGTWGGGVDHYAFCETAHHVVGALYVFGLQTAKSLG